MPNKETRMTDADFARIKSMFAGQEENLKVLRKVFYPELDPENPIGMNFDLWTQLDLSNLTTEQKLVRIEARTMMINHIEQCLNILRTLAGKQDETTEQTKQRLMKDSAK